MSGVPPEALLLGLLLGALLGTVFAVLESVRILLALGRIATAALDVLFCLLAAVTTFLLALAVSGGNLRFFQAACEIIGFSCVDLSLTHAVRRFLPRLVRAARRMSGRLRERLNRVGKIILRKKRRSKAEPGKKRGFFGNKAKKNEKKT
ncbi:MAG: spore cortex biosynthesis protein YabQ [Hominenteromicrobium sp.]